MRNVLEDILGQLLEIEYSNAEIDSRVIELENEFNDLVLEVNQEFEDIEEKNPLLEECERKVDFDSFVKDVNSLDRLHKRYSLAKKNFVGIIVGGAIFVLLAIPLEYFVFDFGVLQGIVFPLISPICNALWRRKQVAEYIVARRDYISAEARVNAKSKTKKIYIKLLELSNETRKLKQFKENNSDKFKKIKKKFIRVLEEKMEEKYRESGIEEKIEIESATFALGSVNLLRLELNKENKKSKGKKMSDIKNIYQSIYDATNRYQALDKEDDKIKTCIDFLNDYLNKAEDKEEAQKQKSQVVIREIRAKKKRNVISFVLMNVCYFMGVGITYPILINVGVSFPMWGIVIHVIIHVLMLGFINKRSFSCLWECIKEAKFAQECAKHLVGQNGEEINQLISLLCGKRNEITSEMRLIEEYLQEADKILARENIKVANEILESHGINAEIEVKVEEKKLRKL